MSNGKSDSNRIIENLQLRHNIEAKVVGSNEELTTFPERLKKILGSESARSFAKRAEILPATFHNYIKGLSEPRCSEIIAIAKTANVNIEWLVSGDGAIAAKKPVYYQSVNDLKDRIFIAASMIGFTSSKTEKEIADIFSLHPAQFRAFISGAEEPLYNQLQEIARLTGVSLRWLVDGIEPILQSNITTPNLPSQNFTEISSHGESLQYRPITDIALPFTITNFQGRQVSFKPDPKLIHIPVLTLEAACGIGTFSDNPYITAMFSATREWLTLNLRRNPDNLCLIHAVGDSMTDTIKPNDMVFVDPEAVKQPSDGIWVYSSEEQIFLKRLQFLPKQKLKVISDNPAYETYTMPIDESFKLLARYIATLNIKT